MSKCHTHFDLLSPQVNNAGVISLGSIENSSLEDYDLMMDVNVRYVLSSFHPDNRHANNYRGVCTNTKIDFKLDLNMAVHSFHCLLSPFTGIGLSRDVHILVTNLENLHFTGYIYNLKIIMVRANKGTNGQPQLSPT